VDDTVNTDTNTNTANSSDEGLAANVERAAKAILQQYGPSAILTAASVVLTTVLDEEPAEGRDQPERITRREGLQQSIDMAGYLAEMFSNNDEGDTPLWPAEDQRPLFTGLYL
jgi:hypothetical protein